MTEQLYYGLNRIAKRLGVSRDVARSMIAGEEVRAHRRGGGKSSPWYCIESELCEDIRKMPYRREVVASADLAYTRDQYDYMRSREAFNVHEVPAREEDKL